MYANAIPFYFRLFLHHFYFYFSFFILLFFSLCVYIVSLCIALSKLYEQYKLHYPARKVLHKISIDLLVEDQTTSYLYSMEITPQEEAPLINLKRSESFWLKDPISLKSPRNR